MNIDGSHSHRLDTEALRRRRAALREFLDHVARRRDPRIAWEAVPALRAEFVDDDDVLRALGGQWSGALAGQIDALLEEHDDLTDVLDEAARRVATARPAVHAVLVAHAQRPVVAGAARREAARLGISSTHAHAGHVLPRFAAHADARPTSGGVRRKGRCRVLGAALPGRRAGAPTRTAPAGPCGARRRGAR